MVNYNQFLKTEEQFGIVYEDYTFESSQTEVVDWAFATLVSHLNLKGMAKPERSAKVDRYQEILETLRREVADEEQKIKNMMSEASL